MSGEYVEKACSLIKECKGVCSVVKVLDEKERSKLLELEKAEEGSMSQFGAGFENQGMKEALCRDVVILIINDNSFEYREPTIVLKAGEEVMGEIISDPAKLQEMKNKPGYMVSGNNFVIYTHKMRGRKGLKMKFITLPFSLPHDNLKNGSANIGVTDVICGWPSRAVDLYIKEKYKIEAKDLKIGTLLVGFNIKKTNG